MKFHIAVTQFLRELKRRKVFQVGSLYLFAAWGASLGAADLLPAFGVSPWGVRMFVIAAFLGFPVVVALTWIYEVSAEGIRVDVGEGDQPRRNQPATTRLAGRGAVQVAWHTGEGEKQHWFANSFTIGRDPGCDICFDDDMVSRRHARVWVDRGVWQVEDLGSRNGTRLDGELISRAPLPPQAELQLYPDGPVLKVALVRQSAAVNQSA